MKTKISILKMNDNLGVEITKITYILQNIIIKGNTSVRGGNHDT